MIELNNMKACDISKIVLVPDMGFLLLAAFTHGLHVLFILFRLYICRQPKKRTFECIGALIERCSNINV